MSVLQVSCIIILIMCSPGGASSLPPPVKSVVCSANTSAHNIICGCSEAFCQFSDINIFNIHRTSTFNTNLFQPCLTSCLPCLAWFPVSDLLNFNIAFMMGFNACCFLDNCTTSIMQSRAFSVVGPLVWNGLPLKRRYINVCNEWMNE